MRLLEAIDTEGKNGHEERRAERNGNKGIKRGVESVDLKEVEKLTRARSSFDASSSFDRMNGYYLGPGVAATLCRSTILSNVNQPIFANDRHEFEEEYYWVNGRN